MSTLNKGALTKWAINQTCEAMYHMLDELSCGTGANPTIDASTVRALIDSAKGAADRTRDQSANYGTIVHALIEMHYFDRDYYPDEQTIFDNMPDHELAQAKDHMQYAVDYITKHDLEPVAAELPVMHIPTPYTDEYGAPQMLPIFGGMIDMICIDANNYLHVLDWKTTNYAYDTHTIQTAAYAFALEKSIPFAFVDGTAVVYPKLKKATESSRADMFGDWLKFQHIAQVWHDAHKTTDLYAHPA